MSKCLNNTTVLGCYTGGAGPVSVVIHYAYDNQGAPAVRITDLAGAPIAGATLANTSAGACAVPSPDVEWVELCDTAANGVVTGFTRRSITSFDAAGVPTTTVANFQLDRVTVYAPTGTVGLCEACAPLASRGIQAAW